MTDEIYNVTEDEDDDIEFDYNEELPEIQIRFDTMDEVE